MDKNLIYKRYMNTRIVIKRYSNIEPLYGSIIGFEPMPLSKMKRWLFVNNIDLIKYSNKNNPDLIMPINHFDIADIDDKIKFE